MVVGGSHLVSASVGDELAARLRAFERDAEALEGIMESTGQAMHGSRPSPKPSSPSGEGVSSLMAMADELERIMDEAEEAGQIGAEAAEPVGIVSMPAPQAHDAVSASREQARVANPNPNPNPNRGSRHAWRTTTSAGSWRSRSKPWWPPGKSSSSFPPRLQAKQNPKSRTPQRERRISRCSERRLRPPPSAGLKPSRQRSERCRQRSMPPAFGLDVFLDVPMLVFVTSVLVFCRPRGETLHSRTRRR